MASGFWGDIKHPPHTPLCVCVLWLGNWWRVHSGPQNTVQALGRQVAFPLGHKQPPHNTKRLGINGVPCLVPAVMAGGTPKTSVFANYFCTSEHGEAGLRNEELPLWDALCLASHCLCYLNILLGNYKDRKWVVQNLTATAVPSFR